MYLSIFSKSSIFSSEKTKDFRKMNIVTVSFKNRGNFKAHVASTPEEQRDGLLKFESVGDYGMLFPFEKTKNASFHCENMRFSIDMLGLRRTANGFNIVNIHENCEPNTGKSFEFANVDGILELSAGTAAKHGIKAGSFCSIKEEKVEAKCKDKKKHRKDIDEDTVKAEVKQYNRVEAKVQARQFLAQMSETTYPIGTIVGLSGKSTSGEYVISDVEGSTYRLQSTTCDESIRIDHYKFKDMVEKGIYTIIQLSECHGDDPSSKVKYLMDEMTEIFNDMEMQSNSNEVHRSDIQDFYEPNPISIRNRKHLHKDDYKVIRAAEENVQKVEALLKTAGVIDEFVMKSARIDGIDNMGMATDGVFTVQAKLYNYRTRKSATVNIPFTFESSIPEWPEYMEDTVGRRYAVNEDGMAELMLVGLGESAKEQLVRSLTAQHGTNPKITDKMDRMFAARLKNEGWELEAIAIAIGKSVEETEALLEEDQRMENAIGASKKQAQNRGPKRKRRHRYTFTPGTRVQVSGGSGIDSDKQGVIVDRSEVETDGRGIPTNISGAYKPIDWQEQVAVRLDNGSLITMYKDRLALEGDSDFGQMVKEPRQAQKDDYDIQRKIRELPSSSEPEPEPDGGIENNGQFNSYMDELGLEDTEQMIIKDIVAIGAKELNWDQSDFEDVADSFDTDASGYGDFEFEADGNEWEGHNDYDSFESAAREDVRNFIDTEGIEYMNQDFVMHYIDEERFIKELMLDVNNWISEEPESYIHEDPEGEDGEYSEEQIEKAQEDYADDVRERGALDWLVEMGYEGEALSQQLSNYIDEDALVEAAVRTDGPAHFLSRYDGNYYETNDGRIFYRTN